MSNLDTVNVISTNASVVQLAAQKILSAAEQLKATVIARAKSHDR